MALGGMNSDDWTGGPAPVQKSRFDVWVDAHPRATAVSALAVLALGGTLKLHDASLRFMTLFFFVQMAALALVYGSMIGGVWLFARLTRKIEVGKTDGLAAIQKRYLFALLIGGFVVSMIIGPALITKGLGYLAELL